MTPATGNMPISMDQTEVAIEMVNRAWWREGVPQIQKLQHRLHTRSTQLPVRHLLEGAGDEGGAADIHVGLAAQPEDAVLIHAPHRHPPRVVKQCQRVRPAQSQLRAGWRRSWRQVRPKDPAKVHRCEPRCRHPREDALARVRIVVIVRASSLSRHNLSDVDEQSGRVPRVWSCASET